MILVGVEGSERSRDAIAFAHEPARATVVVGGVSGRLVRVARSPVVVVPRGVEAPLADLVPAAEQAVG